MPYDFFRPFARLWWDETVPTVVTRAEPHNQVCYHLFAIQNGCLHSLLLNIKVVFFRQFYTQNKIEC